MNLFVHLILFTVLLSTNNAHTSHLGLVVDDLSILTRITNAIALLNSANQKTLKLDNFSSEVLKTEHSVLENLTSINTSLNAEKMGEFFRIVGILSKTAPAGLLPQSQFQQLHRFLGETLENFDMSKVRFSAAKLMQLIENGQGMVLPCDQSVLETVKRFVDSLEKRKDKIPKTLELEHQILMRNATQEVLQCYRACRSYKNETAGKLFEELKKLRETLDMFDILVFYRDHFTLFQSKFMEFIQDMAADFGVSELLDNISEGAGGLLKNLTTIMIQIAKTPGTEKLLTGGFPEGPKELRLVAGDVKSSWFKEKISRGKSTEELEKTLEPFRKFAEQVARLQDPWNFLEGSTNHNYFKIIYKAAYYLHGIGEDLKGLTSPQNYFSKEKQTYGDCWQTSGAGDIKVNWTLFEELSMEPMKVYGDMESVIEAARSMPDLPDIQVLENFLAQLKTVILADSTASMVQNQRDQIRKLVNYATVRDVFHSMKNLHHAQQDYLQLFEDLQADNKSFTSDSFHLEQPVNESNFFKWTTCLKQKRFNPRFLTDVSLYRKYALTLDQGGIQLFKDILNNTDNLQKVLKDIEKAANAMASAKPTVDIQKLRESAGIARHLASGVNVLHEMARVQESADRLRELFQFPGSNVNKAITDKLKGDAKKLQFWKSPETYIERTIAGVATLNTYSKSIRDKELSAIQKLFKEAEKVPGIDMHTDIFTMIWTSLVDLKTDPEAQKAFNNSAELLKWDLDFAAKKKNLDAAYLTVYSVSTFFDIVFGFTKEKQTVVSPSGLSHWTTILFCFAFFAFLVLIAFVIYGFTKSGRRKYRNLYLYYFPNQKEFEKRWRYSLFMDRENGQNALIDASREINHINVQNILARGALVNVFSQFGNTPLHMATKRGFAKVVEVLIKNGADRDIVNVRNQKPEELIPQNCSPIEEEKYAAIRKIYEKYRDRNFRIRVPQEFPTHLFHIFIEKRTDDNLTSNFMNKFQGITSDEALPTTTHCICKTTADGILETDDVDLLAWIFTGVIMVKESWMTDCLQDEKLIGQDSQYLVEHVRYNGVIHENCVIPWTNYLAKGSMPFLFGVFVVFVMKECPKLANLTLIITTLGGVFLESFPTKETFNLGSHPYLHANLGPAFIIHDNSADLTAYKNDPDQLFTLFTEQEFISFLLQRDIQQDTRQHPIPQLAGTE